MVGHSKVGPSSAHNSTRTTPGYWNWLKSSSSWGSCISGGRAGRLVIGRSLVWILAPLSCVSNCPWARYWTPNCSWWAVGTLHRSLRHQCLNVCVNGWTWQTLWAVSRLENGLKMEDHLPFTIIIGPWKSSTLNTSSWSMPMAKTYDCMKALTITWPFNRSFIINYWWLNDALCIL